MERKFDGDNMNSRSIKARSIKNPLFALNPILTQTVQTCTTLPNPHIFPGIPQKLCTTTNIGSGTSIKSFVKPIYNPQNTDTSIIVRSKSIQRSEKIRKTDIKTADTNLSMINKTHIKLLNENLKTDQLESLQYIDKQTNIKQPLFKSKHYKDEMKETRCEDSQKLEKRKSTSSDLIKRNIDSSLPHNTSIFRRARLIKDNKSDFYERGCGKLFNEEAYTACSLSSSENKNVNTNPPKLPPKKFQRQKLKNNNLPSSEIRIMQMSLSMNQISVKNDINLPQEGHLPYVASSIPCIVTNTRENSSNINQKESKDTRGNLSSQSTNETYQGTGSHSTQEPVVRPKIPPKVSKSQSSLKSRELIQSQREKIIGIVPKNEPNKIITECQPVKKDRDTQPPALPPKKLKKTKIKISGNYKSTIQVKCSEYKNNISRTDNDDKEDFDDEKEKPQENPKRLNIRKPKYPDPKKENDYCEVLINTGAVKNGIEKTTSFKDKLLSFCRKLSSSNIKANVKSDLRHDEKSTDKHKSSGYASSQYSSVPPPSPPRDHLTGPILKSEHNICKHNLPPPNLDNDVDEDSSGFIENKTSSLLKSLLNLKRSDSKKEKHGVRKNKSFSFGIKDALPKTKPKKAVSKPELQCTFYYLDGKIVKHVQPTKPQQIYNELQSPRCVYEPYFSPSTTLKLRKMHKRTGFFYDNVKCDEPEKSKESDEDT